MSTSEASTSNRRHSSYHHGNLRQALLKEGMVLLEEVGEAGFSLRELARRVGVTANTAYRHFVNKDVLLMGLAAEGFRLFDNSQRKAWQKAAGNATEKFLATGSNYVRFARSHLALFRLISGRFAAEHRTSELEMASRTAFATLRQRMSAPE